MKGKGVLVTSVERLRAPKGWKRKSFFSFPFLSCALVIDVMSDTRVVESDGCCKKVGSCCCGCVVSSLKVL